MERRTAIAVLLAALLASACSSGPGTSEAPAAPPETTPVSGYHPEIDPANFVRVVDNRYFPLVPGTKFTLEGRTEEGLEHEEAVVTDQTKQILGVTVTVVHDSITIKGELVEDTLDWYAQDSHGNVWYFGEDTKSYSGGKVSTEGSWEAGVDGAEPGIIMPANPQVTDSFRQEYLKGQAEDMFWIVAVDQKASTPYKQFNDVVESLEWTPLEPKVVTQKAYAPGIGIVKETNLAGGLEQFELLDVTQG